MLKILRAKLYKLWLFLWVSTAQAAAIHKIRQSTLFDRAFYRQTNSGMHFLAHWMPERHYVVFGEAADRRPTPEFSPQAYLRQNPDIPKPVVTAPAPAFLHFITLGQFESRNTLDPLPRDTGSRIRLPDIPITHAPRAQTAIVVHVFYAEIWDSIADRLLDLDFDFDLFISVTTGTDDAANIKAKITATFPSACRIDVPNHGRDILPFIHFINSGVLDSYQAICKLHTKKSPHLSNGQNWREHLIEGLLPVGKANTLLQNFIANTTCTIWVADDQKLSGERWWGYSKPFAQHLLKQVGIPLHKEALIFPAGSMFWVKSNLIARIKALRMKAEDFEHEYGQLEGTTAHALERVIGILACQGGGKILETHQMYSRAGQSTAHKPDVS